MNLNKYILDNGVKLIYEHRPAGITSFCIGFNGGAIEETDEFPLGTAHAVEHMVSKGTKTRSEKEINNLCDKIFGFENAMTNFPYVIYYGTSLSEDFKAGFELYSDIVLNPAFRKDGFKEEMNIILEELKEWKDDIYQHCEDSLLYNAFNNKRIKNLIIGTEESVKSITLKHIKDFYQKYYVPENCVISVCSSLSCEQILSVVKEYFGQWLGKNEVISTNIDKSKSNIKMERNMAGIFEEKSGSIGGAKIQYLFNIEELEENELKALTLFNAAFGEGTSSVLFEEIRTKNALAYDVGSYIKNERGIKIFTINLGTSEDKVQKALDIIGNKIEELKKLKGYFNEERIKELSKNIKLKRQLKLEKSIQLCKELTTYELMYDRAERIYEEVDGLQSISEENILEVIRKVLINPTIQIITKG